MSQKSMFTTTCLGLKHTCKQSQLKKTNGFTNNRKNKQQQFKSGEMRVVPSTSSHVDFDHIFLNLLTCKT